MKSRIQLFIAASMLLIAIGCGSKDAKAEVAPNLKPADVPANTPIAATPGGKAASDAADATK